MNNKSIIFMSVVIVFLLTFVILTTYAYFANAADAINTSKTNTRTEQNNLLLYTTGGDLALNVTAGKMSQFFAGNLADESSANLTVYFTSNTDYDMVCSYDIVYEWTSDEKYAFHTPGVTDNEFTIQAMLNPDIHSSEGTNNIASETDLSVAVGNQTSSHVVRNAKIDSRGSDTSAAVWTLTTRFYNTIADQTALAGKVYSGRFIVSDVSCVMGTANN